MDFLFVGNTCLERNAIFYIKKAYFPLFYLQLNMVNKVFAFRVPFEFSYSNRLGFYLLFFIAAYSGDARTLSVSTLGQKVVT